MVIEITRVSFIKRQMNVREANLSETLMSRAQIKFTRREVISLLVCAYMYCFLFDYSLTACKIDGIFEKRVLRFLTSNLRVKVNATVIVFELGKSDRTRVALGSLVFYSPF